MTCDQENIPLLMTKKKNEILIYKVQEEKGGVDLTEIKRSRAPKSSEILQAKITTGLLAYTSLRPEDEAITLTLYNYHTEEKITKKFSKGNNILL